MGVYISKLMDMPEHCYECLLRQGNCCLLLYEAIPPTVPLTRLDTCPLIEIDLVRCGECMRRKKNGFCLEHNRYEKNDDNFCSYGERRADE